ncbi:uncharacterized protein LOC106668305 isoform X2 [Cimex lectularius]|nr:uncharacterized protein LOC106668305 isoform X2 [Cimex lectularius]XP_014252407.1 uncharacterized protein LOC106668305 isoform X2 [Cimex lectularius]
MKDKNVLANFERKSHNIHKKPEGLHGKMSVPISGMEQPISNDILDIKEKEVVILRRTKSSPIQKERDEKALANAELKNLIKKFDDLRRKIVLTVNGIEQALNDEPLDISREEVDILRSKKRNSAFTSRFKGNYHYQLVCQINDIKKILSNETILKTRPIIIMQKFVSAHQNVLQALQALEKHLLASCSSEESFRWLKEFIESISELTSMLPNYDGINIDTMDNHSNVNLACHQLMDKIDRLNDRREAEAKMLKKRASRKIKSGNAPQDNLWMYRTHRLTWKEKAADLAKFQIARRKRKKGARDELLCEKTAEPSELKLLKMEVKQREGSELRRHSRSVREEQVRTMMEIIPEESESDVEIKKNVKCDLITEESMKQDTEPAKAKLQELIDCRNAVMLAAKTEEQKKEEIVEQKSEFPSNVKLVYIKCENEDIKPSRQFKLSRPSSPISESNKLFQLENRDVVCDYRTAFKSFKSQSVWYDENVNNMVNSITTRLTDEIIKDVVKEINVDHIIRKIIDLELQEL